jgi:4-hydroxybenzoate polyprenyltransferase
VEKSSSLSPVAEVLEVNRRTAPIRSATGQLRAFGELLRPAQWIKNLWVFAAPALSLRLLELDGALKSVVMFLSFCLISSAGYAINDVRDRQADAVHPQKRRRPVARGAITAWQALLAAAVLLALSVGLSAAFLPPRATGILLAYFVLILLYSFYLKRRVILDVITIASGFVLRALGGAEAVAAPISPWLIACTFTLCMFLGFGKRQCEVAAFEDKEQARAHRDVLNRYTPDLLQHLLTVSAGIAIITFLLYTMDTSYPTPFPKQHLLYTLPLVCYGVFRYAMAIELGERTGPTDIFIKDRPFLATVAIWLLIAGAIILEPKWRPATVASAQDTQNRQEVLNRQDAKDAKNE